MKNAQIIQEGKDSVDWIIKNEFGKEKLEDHRVIIKEARDEYSNTKENDMMITYQEIINYIDKKLKDYEY